MAIAVAIIIIVNITQADQMLPILSRVYHTNFGYRNYASLNPNYNDNNSYNSNNRMNGMKANSGGAANRAADPAAKEPMVAVYRATSQISRTLISQARGQHSVCLLFSAGSIPH